MSTFNPDTFLTGAVVGEFTERPLLPPGDYIGIIGDLKPPQSGQQRKDPTKTWYALNVPIEVDTNQKPGVREMIGQDKVVLFDFVGLDITEGGALDFAKGRNTALRAYRVALNMNDPTAPFIPLQMIGRQILVKVGQREYNGKMREDVQGVAKVA